MTNSVKERISEDLQKAKSEGSLRAERIRDIVKAAVSEAVAELSQGTGELRTIARDALTAVFEAVKDRPATRTEEIAASVEGVAEGIGESHREAIAHAQEQINDLQQHLDQADQLIEAEITTALTTVDMPEAETATRTPLKTLIDMVMNTVKEREVYAVLEQRYAQLKQQLAELDARLMERYGDRYEEVKHQLDNAQVWYTNAKAEGKVNDVQMAELKQVQLQEKAANFGATVAQKEAQLKEQVRHILNNVLNR